MSSSSVSIISSEIPQAPDRTHRPAQETMVPHGCRYLHYLMQLNIQHISYQVILLVPHQSTLISRNCSAKKIRMTAIAVPHVNAFEVRYYRCISDRKAEYLHYNSTTIRSAYVSCKLGKYSPGKEME